MSSGVGDVLAVPVGLVLLSVAVLVLGLLSGWEWVRGSGSVVVVVWGGEWLKVSGVGVSDRSCGGDWDVELRYLGRGGSSWGLSECDCEGIGVM